MAGRSGNFPRSNTPKPFSVNHHPKITAGKRHCDYDMFHVLPSILAASDRAAANAVLLHWIDELGAVTPCGPCAHLNEKDLSLQPDFDWISDEATLGTALSQKLRAIRQKMNDRI